MTTLSASDLNVNAVIAGTKPKYIVNIEGIEHQWHKETITTEEIAALGGWINEGVIEIDSNNIERTLNSYEVINLKRGLAFAKKIRWKRGDGMFELRLASEFNHLKGHFTNAKQKESWFLIPNYPLPEGWSLQHADMAFRVISSYPGTPPYGFFVPAGLRFKDTLPCNYQEAIKDVPPFEGAWGMFSWTPEDWRSSDDVAAGYNLLNFALSFAVRLREGA